MHPKDTVYRFPGTMSAEFSAFRRQLPGGGYGAPPEILGPVTAVDELRYACEKLISGRGSINRGDRTSLVVDVRLALKQLGPRAALAAGPVLDQFVRDLSQAHARLETATGARGLLLETREVLDRLKRGDVRAGAFVDAWHAFAKPKTPAPRCELRLLQLRELAEHGGHQWRAIASRLESVMADRRRVVSALVDDVPEEGDDPAGTSEEVRLRLCADLVAAEPATVNIAIWLVIAHEALAQPWLRLGPVQLFAGWTWPEQLGPEGCIARDFADYEPPRELADDRVDPDMFLSRIETEKVVLARVWFANTPAGALAERARETLEALIEVAHPRSRWKLYDGHFGWSENGGWFGGSLHPPGELDDANRPVHPVFEGTEEELRALDDRLADRLVAGDPVLSEAVDEARFAIAVQQLRTAEHRIALGTRALERTLSVAATRDDDWQRLARRYLLAPWLKHVLYQELFDIGASAPYWHPERTFGHRDGPNYRRLDQMIWTDEDHGRRRFSLVGFRDAATELADALEDGTVIHRLVRDANTSFTSSDSALALIDELETRFDRLIARAERFRNALIHGGRIPAGALPVVDEFLYLLGAYSAQETMRSAETGADPLVELQRARSALLEAKEALRSGSDIVSALFPEEVSAG